MIKKRRPSAAGLARQLGIPKSRGVEAVLKAQLIAAVTREIERRRLTHAEVAARSGLPRTAVTGILSGSLQKVTIDRVLRLLEAVGLMMRGPSTPCGDVRAELARDSDLTIMRPRTRPNGEPCEVGVCWVIYHMLEHFAGHFGQILLLQHARQALGVGDAAGRQRARVTTRRAAIRGV